MYARRQFLFVVLLCIAAKAARADEITASALAAMPVREITVFKDGHAFMLHEGEVTPDAEGNVQLNYLPAPVLGTFWPYSADERIKLVAASAGRTRISIERPALQLRELLEANIGAKALIREHDRTYLATIESVPFREPRDEHSANPESPAPQREQGSIVLLGTEDGTRAINIDAIRDVTFLDEPRGQIADHEYRNLLKMRLDWQGQRPAEKVRVGMTYLQRGIRWIPEYRITLDGNGQAQIELQAKLINEFADLNDVKAHFVIGVPTFAFKDTIDPIALTQSVGQLSQYFQQPNQTAYAFSNAIMLQTQARMQEVRAVQPSEQPGSELPEFGGHEDLFIFTVEHITLDRGERMVVPIGKWQVPYKDRYVLHIPVSPPQEMMQQIDNQQQAEIAKLLTAPKVQHKVRLENTLQVPFTTAPALLMSEGRVLGQGMMTYAAPGGGIADVDVTTAVNFAVHHEDEETGRADDALKWGDYALDRVDMGGTIRITSFLQEQVQLEVIRETLGPIDQANQEAKIQQLGTRFDPSYRPVWWAWYSWPVWWRHVASIGRARWEVTIEPRETIELTYQWHYFWAW